MPDSSPLVLLTGATGYVGGRPLPALEAHRFRVRCLVRRPDAFRHQAGPATEVVVADLLDRSSLDVPLHGVDAAFYLVHSMGSSGSFEDADRQAARNFGAAAKASGVSRIIYLGGLGSTDEALSHICAAATRSVTSCARPASRCSSFAPQSSLAPAASRSR